MCWRARVRYHQTHAASEADWKRRPDCRWWPIPARTWATTCLRWKVRAGPRATVKVRTGIAVEARDPTTGRRWVAGARPLVDGCPGIATTGGVIDAGYRGEILVLMTNLGEPPWS